MGRGWDRALDPTKREDFGRRFGVSFSHVRIHDDDEAHQSAAALGARAFTENGEIHFGAGYFAPQTRAERRLIAYELTQSIQQSGASGRSPSLGREVTLEREADRTADAIVEGAPSVNVLPGTASPGLSCDFVNNPAGIPVAFEFRFGIELSLSFVALAKQLLGGGSLHTRGLLALRDEARRRHGSVDDIERMFMAGLTRLENAALLDATRVVPGESVTFRLPTIQPNMPAVRALVRRTPSAEVTDATDRSVDARVRGDLVGAWRLGAAASTAAEREILSYAGAFVTGLAPRASRLLVLGMTIEALSDRGRFEPVLVQLGGGYTPPASPADVAGALNMGESALVTLLRQWIAADYGFGVNDQSLVDGLSGDSQLDWIFRL